MRGGRLLGNGAWMILLLVWLFPVRIAFANHCVVAGIAVVAGPWESTEEKTSYTVQAQDSTTVACHASETLRLSFQSSEMGTFTGQTGSPVQAWIATGSANRNFYYHRSGTGGTLTIKAGYGTADNWSVLWEASADASEPAPSVDEVPVSTSSGAVGQSAADSQTGTAISQASSGRGEDKSTALASPRLFADDPLSVVVSHPKRASTGQPAQFAAVPSGLEEAQLRTLRYGWNFGDGTTAVGRTPAHAYARAGTYVVIGSVSRQGHEIVIRTHITITPLVLALAHGEDGELLLRNMMPEETEVSGLTVTDGAHSFTLPDGTYLAPSASLALLPAITGLKAATPRVFAYDRQRTLVAQYPPAVEQGDEQGGGARTVAAAPAKTESQTETKKELGRKGTEGQGEKGTATQHPATSVAEPAVRPVSARADNLSYTWQSPATAQSAAPQARRTVPFAFIGVLFVGVLALYVHKIV